METQQLEEQEQVAMVYSPARLLDALIAMQCLRNDAALSRLLQINPPVICKIRKRKAALTASILIRMHEETGLSIAELRMLAGDRRAKMRVSSGMGKNARE